MNRRSFLHASGVLLATAAASSIGVSGVKALPNVPLPAMASDEKFPLMDLHVHCNEKLSIDEIVNRAGRLGIIAGVMENIAPWGIKTDGELSKYISSMRKYPVLVGLQPMNTGWAKNFSPELVSQADYVVMDPQVVSNDHGERIYVWEYDAYVDNAEKFMERNVEHYVEILSGAEPLNVFACPLLLPFCIERDYNVLWTKSRMEQVIDAARTRGIAFEINNTMHVPHEKFIVMAKKAGLKFTFGSDCHNDSFGRLDYCKRVAVSCGLTEKDFYIPKRKA